MNRFMSLSELKLCLFLNPDMRSYRRIAWWPPPLLNIWCNSWQFQSACEIVYVGAFFSANPISIFYSFHLQCVLLAEKLQITSTCILKSIILLSLNLNNLVSKSHIFWSKWVRFINYCKVSSEWTEVINSRATICFN